MYCYDRNKKGHLVAQSNFPVNERIFLVTENKFSVTIKTKNTLCHIKNISWHRRYTFCDRLNRLHSCHRNSDILDISCDKKYLPLCIKWNLSVIPPRSKTGKFLNGFKLIIMFHYGQEHTFDGLKKHPGLIFIAHCPNGTGAISKLIP